MEVLGTHPEDIDRAEDRDKFSAMLDSIGVDQVSPGSISHLGRVCWTGCLLIQVLIVSMALEVVPTVGRKMKSGSSCSQPNKS